MTSSPDEPSPDASSDGNGRPQNSYKYDVAVSFAGEQREYVEHVVRELKLPKARVFYDADYKAELWGTELTELFTTLYATEARYVVMFISREYLQKEWTRTERRAALQQRMRLDGAYILPVCLDSTRLSEVPGLLDTIGYLDGVREGATGVAKCLGEKLATAIADIDRRGAEAPVGAHIVADPKDLTALLQGRPSGWQWAAFGSVLFQRRRALESRLRDHRLGFGPPTGQRLNNTTELRDFVTHCVNDVDQVRHQLGGLVATPAFSGVFGAKEGDESADPDGITHCATRLMDLYERFLQLAERARGVSAPPEFVNALDSCARLVDRPLAGMDEFIDEYVAYVNDLARRTDEERASQVRHVITLPIPAISEELLLRLKRQLDDASSMEEKTMPS